MTTELATCLQSVKDLCPELKMMIIDDASTDPRTRQIIDKYSSLFREILLQDPVEKVHTRGRLGVNIQLAYNYAVKNGYEYLFLVQDDMQFVRPLNDAVFAEYSAIFEKDSSVIQVDPRFLRRVGELLVDPKVSAYTYCETDDRRSFADVGILSLQRLQELNWKFEKNERLNKEKAHSMGLRRIFPFTPTIMHLPYPKLFRKGEVIRQFPWPLVKRGECAFEYMSAKDIARMDSRPIEFIPFARDILKTKGVGLAALHYRFGDEERVFS